MAKKKKKNSLPRSSAPVVDTTQFSATVPPENTEDRLLVEILQHYRMWTEDNQRRMTRKNGWNDVTDAYWGHLPSDWPYMSKVVDPRLRTSLIEKNSRLLNAKLRGHLVPREDGDVLGAQLHNALLDIQWDSASHGGSMLSKFEIADMDTRLYGSKFAYIPWIYEEDDEGNVTFDGNEFFPLDIRDSGIDPTAHNIRDAKWFQMRTYDKFEDLENMVDADGNPLYDLTDVKQAILQKLSVNRSSTRTTDYVPRLKTLTGMQDRTGEDIAFPTVKKVIEFRKDKFITFLPDYAKVISVIDNPFKHGKIPVAQLKYYPIQDEPLGESEAEAVLPIWKAIQATLCAYLDEMVLKIRPPLKIIENAARIETIEYGPEAQWLVDRQDAVEEMVSSGDSQRYFQTTYTALTAAFNIAMGDISQGTSNVTPFPKQNKTATEINASMVQQNARDQKNQNDLANFIKDVMEMWMENNRQFLFSNPKRLEYIVRLVGKSKFANFQKAGLDATEVPNEVMQMISDIIKQHPEITDFQLQQLLEAGSLPKYPVVMNPEEKNPDNIIMKQKMRMSEYGDMAEISLTPEDLQGTYDYVPDVKSMSVGAGEERSKAQQQVLQAALNPTVMQMLYMEGWQIKLKDVLEDSFEQAGYRDAESVFQSMGGNEPPMLGMGNIRETMNFKDLPPDLRAQMAMRAGFQPSQQDMMQQPQAQTQPQGTPQQGGMPQQQTPNVNVPPQMQ